MKVFGLGKRISSSSKVLSKSLSPLQLKNPFHFKQIPEYLALQANLRIIREPFFGYKTKKGMLTITRQRV